MFLRRRARRLDEEEGLSLWLLATEGDETAEEARVCIERGRISSFAFPRERGGL